MSLRDHGAESKPYTCRGSFESEQTPRSQITNLEARHCRVIQTTARFPFSGWSPTRAGRPSKISEIHGCDWKNWNPVKILKFIDFFLRFHGGPLKTRCNFNYPTSSRIVLLFIWSPRFENGGSSGRPWKDMDVRGLAAAKILRNGHGSSPEWHF